MKKVWRRSLNIVLAIIILVTSVGLMPVQTDAAVEIFLMNRTKKTMVIGSSYQFKVNASSGKVKWTSSDQKVARVSKTGKVTAKKKGKTVIKAVVKKNGKTTVYKCTLTVITQQKSYESETIRLINRQRRRYGWSSLSSNVYLQSAAQKRAKEVATQKFSSKRPNGTYFTSAISMKYDFAKAGQTIACDFATPEDVVDAWMKNAGTKAQIINKRFTDIGVGVYLADDGYLYWVAIFACKK